MAGAAVMFLQAIKGIISRITGGDPVGNSAVVSVEVVELYTGTAWSANLTKGQDPTQCVPFATWHMGPTTTPADSPDYLCYDIDIYDNSGTPAVQISRRSASGQHTVTIYVVEFNEDIKVQKIAGQTGFSTLETLTCAVVDQSKAFIIDTAKAVDSGTLDDHDDYHFKVYFVDNTTIGFARAGAPNWRWYHICYVVEDISTNNDHFTVQAVNITATGAGTQDGTITTAVDPDTTMIVVTSDTNNGGTDARQSAWTARLFNSTTVRIEQTSTTTSNLTAFVVEWIDGTRVLRGQHTYSGLDNDDGTHQESYTFGGSDTVDVDRSIVHSTRHQIASYGVSLTLGDLAYDHIEMQQMFSLAADGTGVLVDLHDSLNGFTCSAYWEAIEFVQGGPWTPARLTGLYTWVEVGDIADFYQDSAKTTAVTSNGDPVGAWVDKSGNGRDFIQATNDNLKPTYQTNYVTFSNADGAEDYLSRGFYSTVDEWMCGIRAYRATASTGNCVWFSIGSSITDTTPFLLIMHSGTEFRVYCDGNYYWDTTKAEDTWTTAIVRVTKPSTNYLIDVWLDGTKLTQHDAGTSMAFTDSQNMFMNSHSGTAVGDRVAGLVLAHGTFTDQDAENLSDYLDVLEVPSGIISFLANFDATHTGADCVNYVADSGGNGTGSYFGVPFNIDAGYVEIGTTSGVEQGLIWPHVDFGTNYDIEYRVCVFINTVQGGQYLQFATSNPNADDAIIFGLGENEARLWVAGGGSGSITNTYSFTDNNATWYKIKLEVRNQTATSADVELFVDDEQGGGFVSQGTTSVTGHNFGGSNNKIGPRTWYTSGGYSGMPIYDYIKVTPIEVPSGISPFLKDTFTDTDSTLLSAHTADTGESWDYISGSTPQILNNTCDATGTVNFMIEGSYRDCITTAQLRTGGTQQATGRYWCQDNNFQNGFHIWADDAYLQFRAGGTNWNDYSNAKNNTVYEVVTAVKGDYCDVWIDGEHLFTYKDAGFFTNGRHGFRFYNPDSTQYVDDLEMYTCLVSPTQVTDCLFWLDASDRGTTTNQWDDKSGNGNHFVSTNAAYFPTFAGGAATFDGSLTFLEGPDLSALTEGEIFLVMNRYADTSESGGNTGWMHFGTDTVQNDHFAYLNSIYTDFGVTSRQGIGNPTGSLATDMVVNISVDSTSGFDFSLSGLINGLTVHRFNNASVTVDFSSAPTLGKSDGAYYFQGDIKAVVMYSRKLTTVERALVTAYLKDTHF